MGAEAVLDGLYKEVYGTSIENLIPRSMILQQDIPFEQENRVGLNYNQPVILTDEAGFTYATQTITSSTAFALNNAIGCVMDNAQVAPSEIVLRSWLSYQQAAQATSGGKAAFASATELQFENNIKSMRKRVELSMLYGRSSYGLGTTASSSNQSATNTNVVLTAATWASGIWSGLINSTFNFYDNGVLVSTGSDAIFTLTTVTPSSRTLNITGTSTGITALDSAISSDPTQVKIHFQGAYSQEFYGLDAIAINTGTLFGISASTYDLWKGTDATITGSLTMGKLLGTLSDAVGRGLDEDVITYVNPITWNDLNTNQAALRVYDQSYKKSEAESGFEKIVYYGQNGRITIKPHIYMKAGMCISLVPEQIRRIGGVDVTYQQPGRGDRIFFDIPAYAGYEFRSYTDQAIICKKPATLVKISGFTNSTA